MDVVPLRLTLAPVLPARTASRRRGHAGHGFWLRLPDGPVVEKDDPLLAAFGAQVVELLIRDDHAEAVQHESFDPGRRLTLELDPFDPSDPDAVGVWDVDSVRQGGELPGGIDVVATAAIEHGLQLEAVALWEERDRFEERRVGLTALVYAPSFVRLEGLDEIEYARPQANGRGRLVLFADGSGDVRWWDPAGAGGPLELGDVPVSGELAADLERLRSDYGDVADRARVGSATGYDRFEDDVERAELERRARLLWQRARREIGRRLVLGYLGQDMERPVWSPAELTAADEDDDIEF